MIHWEKIYNKLIEKNKNQLLVEGQYYEKHHIIPRYLGGGNEKSNLIHLTFGEHTLAHYILYRWKGNLEDKIAYKMMSGQTEEGRILKQQLAVKKSNESDKVKIIKELYKDKKYTENVVKKRKETLLRDNPDNDGYYYSKEARKKLSNLTKLNYDKIHTKEIIKKRSESLKQTINNMSQEEFYNRYQKYMEGPLHPMYGKKRLGKLAGNYGKSKGIYILITPEKEKIEFDGIKKLIKYGINELTIRKWSNKGIIQKDPKCNKPFKWDGYEIQFIENPNYGNINKKVLNRKKDWSDL
jgi:hypothetical protein